MGWMSHEGINSEDRRVGRAMLSQYGIDASNLRLLQSERDAVVKVHARGGEGFDQYVLRIERRRGTSAAEIRSRCQWLRALRRDARLKVPEPVANLHGEDVTSVRTGRGTIAHGTLMRWIEGRPRFRPGGPGVDVLRRVGRLMAAIHAHGQTYRPPPGFRCKRWDADGLFGRMSPWRPVRPLELDAKQRALVRRVMRRTRDSMHRLGTRPDSFGLIHGDLTQANYLCRGRDVAAIDFGDFGRGYYLYDMAVTLLMLKPFDPAGRQRAAFLCGYAETRPLPPQCDSLLDLFIAARAVVLARWLLGRRSPDAAERKWVRDTFAWVSSGSASV
jgi:Ser/Thr protein kinase RdoA (MazF antagonist)